MTYKRRAVNFDEELYPYLGITVPEQKPEGRMTLCRCSSTSLLFARPRGVSTLRFLSEVERQTVDGTVQGGRRGLDAPKGVKDSVDN